MSLHRVHFDGMLPPPPAPVRVTGDEARHALAVKRVRVGDAVELFTGAGTLALARVVAGEARAGKGREPWLDLAIERLRHVEPTRPELDVRTATPKGARADELVEQLSQIGAAAWSPLRTGRAVVEPGAGKADRLARIALESAKQCGRAWTMRVGPLSEFAESLSEPGAALIVADATGEPYAPIGGDRLRLLIGPEGGWTSEELAAARAAGASIRRFGPHVLRIETAAVAAAAVIMNAEGPEAPDTGRSLRMPSA